MTKQVSVGGVRIGGGAPVSVQSMCNIPFDRFDELVAQAQRLEAAGCELLRVSVPDFASAERFGELKTKITVPLIADIHFDYRLAIAAIEAGADKIRINPGNTGAEHLGDIVRAARAHRVPIRVGINSGSLEKDLLARYRAPTAEALAESALRNVRLLEKLDFTDILVSIKSSDVRTMIAAYRRFSESSDYPLHLGVTEAGTLISGVIKSSLGIGALLLDGIGDTIRVSLTADPVEEIRAALSLLRALNLRRNGLELISCPTCGRTTVNVMELAEKLEQEFADIPFPLKIAVMGCVVNGPGEAGQADFGVTGANGRYVLFRNGETVLTGIEKDRIFDVIREQAELVRKRFEEKDRCTANQVPDRTYKT